MGGTPQQTFSKRQKYLGILDLQSIPRESNNKDVAAMLVELTIEANEESFVIVHQHGGNDVTCKSRIEGFHGGRAETMKQFCMKIYLISQGREKLLFLPSNMATMTSHENAHTTVM